MKTTPEVIRHAVQAWARPFWRWQELVADAQGEFPDASPEVLRQGLERAAIDLLKQAQLQQIEAQALLDHTRRIGLRNRQAIEAEQASH